MVIVLLLKYALRINHPQLVHPQGGRREKNLPVVCLSQKWKKTVQYAEFLHCCVFFWLWSFEIQERWPLLLAISLASIGLTPLRSFLVCYPSTHMWMYEISSNPTYIKFCARKSRSQTRRRVWDWETHFFHISANVMMISLVCFLSFCGDAV